MNTKLLHLIGLNHKTAPIEVRETFALDRSDGLFSEQSEEGGFLREHMLLSTCNRVEILAVSEDPLVARKVMERWAEIAGRPVSDLSPHVYSYCGEQAIEHLFSVASSLDSMIVGEPQILGQLKKAYRKSFHNHTAGVITNRLMHKSFFVAKRVRTETRIASQAVSISYAAVELARRIFENMEGISCLLIGAGDMAELAATHLLSAGVSNIAVTNRTHENALALADNFKGHALPFDDLEEFLGDFDIIISSTGAPNFIISAQAVKNALEKRGNKPVFFIDIAVPRDVDPDVNDLDNAYLYDIDDLTGVVQDNISQRLDEVEKASAIVREECALFCGWLKSLDLQPTIVDLIRRADKIAKDELERTLKRAGPLPDDVVGQIRIMLDSVIKKLHHEPITFLKRRFAEDNSGVAYINIARRMFNLDDDGGGVCQHRGSKVSLYSECVESDAELDCDFSDSEFSNERDRC